MLPRKTYSMLDRIRRNELSGSQALPSAPDGSWIAVGVPNGTNSYSTNSSLLPYTHGLTGVHVSLDQYITDWLWASILAVALIFLACRLYQLFNSHFRHIYSMAANGRQQNYWTYDKSIFWPNFKKYGLYAPLWKKRHNREIQLSRAVNVGTIPSRFHAIILFLYVASNVIYCCVLDYRNNNKAALIAEVRGRTGVLATANMIPLVLMAGRNNPGIALLRVSFDTFNLLHRWIGRIVIAEALAHTIAWGANSVQARGMHDTMSAFRGDAFLLFGLIGTIAMFIILIQSLSPIRHAFYETFLHLHQLLASATILGVYVHLEIAKLPTLPYIRAVVGIWAGERIVRSLRLFYLNLSRRYGCTRVVVEALPGEACRVTFHLPRHVTVRPGSHIYAYLPRVSLWMSHPFSVAWTDTHSEPPTGAREIELEMPRTPMTPMTPETPNSLEKQAEKTITPPSTSQSPTSISLIVAARTGMTRALYNRAMRSPDHTLRMSGYIEGPYAGHDSLASYGTVILFAGGAGITHHLIQVRHLIACASARTVATRKIVLVWSVRNVEMLTWVRPWMDEILQMPGRREVLRMELYVTKPRNSQDLVSPSKTVKLYPGRCKPETVLNDELPTRIGATTVSVCGPGAFADEVRAAVRERMHWGALDFIEEAFTW